MKEVVKGFGQHGKINCFPFGRPVEERYPRLLMNVVFFSLVPLFSFSGCSKRDRNSEIRTSVNGLSSAIASANQASAIINSGTAYSLIDTEDSNRMIRFFKNALGYAETADRDVLNEIYNGLGDHFESEFIKGIQMIVSSHENLDLKQSMEGQKLLRQWDQWFNEHHQEITRRR